MHFSLNTRRSTPQSDRLQQVAGISGTRTFRLDTALEVAT